MDQEFKKKISLLGGLCLLLLALTVMLDKIGERQVVQKRAVAEVVNLSLSPPSANITQQGTTINIIMTKETGAANKNVRGAEVVIQLDTQAGNVFEVSNLSCGPRFPRAIVKEITGRTISLACSQQTGGVSLGPVVLGAEVLGSFVLRAKSGATEGTQGYLHLISGHIPLAGGDYHNLMGAGTGGLYTVAGGPPITPTATATPLPGCPVCPSNITLESVARVPNNGKYNIRVRWPNHPDSRGYDVYRQIGSGVWEYAALVKETTPTLTYLDQNRDGQGFAPGLQVRYRLNPRKATCPSLTCPATSPITVGPIPTATPTGPTATPTLTCVDGCYNYNPQSLAVCNNNCQTKTGHNCVLINEVGLCAWAPAYRCCFAGPGPTLTVSPSPTSTPMPTATPGVPTVIPSITPTGVPAACQAVNKVIEVTPPGGAGTCHDLQEAVDAVLGDGYKIKLAAGIYEVPDRKDFSVKVIGKSNLTIEGDRSKTNEDVQVSFLNNRGGFYFENSTGELAWLKVFGSTSNGLVYLKNSPRFLIVYASLSDEGANTVQINTSQKFTLKNSKIKSSSVAIYPSGSTEVIVDNNIILGSNIGIEASNSSGEIKFNLIQHMREAYIMFNDSGTNFSIDHNTLVAESGWDADGAKINKNSRFTNNIVANTGRGGKCGLIISDGSNADFASERIAHNDFFNVGRVYCSINCPAGQCSFVSGTHGNISADPLFGNNYCLRSGSPAIYGDPTKQEFMGHIGPCTIGTPTLNFSVKFQGITTKRTDQKVKVRVKKGTLDLSFPNVTVTADSNGIYSGSVVLTGVSPEDKYTIFIKGPKHLARKFCANNQTARCLGEGNITLVAGNNTFDFSKLILEGGDLPNPNESNRQDGVANSVDWSLIKNRLGSTAAADLVIADINLDEQVNSIDQILMRNTLETKYEEEE